MWTDQNFIGKPYQTLLFEVLEDIHLLLKVSNLIRNHKIRLIPIVRLCYLCVCNAIILQVWRGLMWSWQILTQKSKIWTLLECGIKKQARTLAGQPCMHSPHCQVSVKFSSTSRPRQKNFTIDSFSNKDIWKETPMNICWTNSMLMLQNLSNVL